MCFGPNLPVDLSDTGFPWESFQPSVQSYMPCNDYYYICHVYDKVGSSVCHEAFNKLSVKPILDIDLVIRLRLQLK